MEFREFLINIGWISALWKICVAKLPHILGKSLVFVSWSWYQNYDKLIWSMIGWLIFDVERQFQQHFSNIIATSFTGGRSRSTRREPPTMGKQLVNFITSAASRVQPFCYLQSRARTHAVLVIGLYESSGTFDLKNKLIQVQIWARHNLKSKFNLI